MVYTISMKLSYWVKTPKGEKCKECGKLFLSRKIRRIRTGYCHPCRMKLAPPALGSKRPDAAIILSKYRRYGKDNHFSWMKFKGKDHAHWKGINVGYHALHTWLQRELGKPETCEFCSKTDLVRHKIHWANKSREYKRDVNDWIRLCAKCHWHYDRDKKYAKH